MTGDRNIKHVNFLKYIFMGKDHGERGKAVHEWLWKTRQIVHEGKDNYAETKRMKRNRMIRENGLSVTPRQYRDKGKERTVIRMKLANWTKNIRIMR